MQFLPLSSINVPKRQRGNIAPKDLQDLITSISKVGLIHPILVLQAGEVYHLIVGERRFQALKELSKTKKKIHFAGKPLPPATIPATVLSSASDILRQELELDENLIRINLSWQDQMRAIATIHALQVAKNPTHKQVDTGRMLQEAGTSTTETPPNKLVSMALTLSPQLDRPDLSRAKSALEAYHIILDERRETFEAVLHSKLAQDITKGTTLWTLKKGDASALIRDVPPGSVDLILCDPPYGIGVHKDKYSAGLYPLYEDSPEIATKLALLAIQEGFEVTKTKANLFIFSTLKLFPTLVEAASRMGWTPWYHPIIWHKGKDGEAPWGRLGVIKTYEIIFWATKGQRGLDGPIPDVLTSQRVHNQQKIHAAQKPLDLLRFLIERSTLPNDMVLDICAGSGATLAAASASKRRSLGFELDDTYYNKALIYLNSPASKEVEE